MTVVTSLRRYLLLLTVLLAIAPVWLTRGKEHLPRPIVSDRWSRRFRRS